MATAPIHLSDVHVNEPSLGTPSVKSSEPETSDENDTLYKNINSSRTRRTP